MSRYCVWPKGVKRRVHGISERGEDEGRSAAAPPGKHPPDRARGAGLDRHRFARHQRAFLRLAEVRERVQDDSRLAYRPNIIARSLRTQQSGSFGVVIPNVSNAHFSDAVRAMQDDAERAGYTTLIVNTDNQLEREQAAIRSLRARRRHRARFRGQNRPRPARRLGRARRWWRWTAASSIHRSRVIDTRKGTRDAVLHLAAQGRSASPSSPGPPPFDGEGEARGLPGGTEKGGLDHDATLVFPRRLQLCRRSSAGAGSSAPPRPDGIIAANNLMALGAMRALLRAKLAFRTMSLSSASTTRTGPTRSSRRSASSRSRRPRWGARRQCCCFGVSRGRRPGRAARDLADHPGAARIDRRRGLTVSSSAAYPTLPTRCLVGEGRRCAATCTAVRGAT